MPADVALDAMGGDAAPRAAVEGAVLAAREHGLEVLLVGDEKKIAAELSRLPTRGLGLEIRHAPQVVEMCDAPSVAVRGKPASSLRIALECVRSGEARAAVSAGNSGALMAAGMFVLGTLPGVERPAIAVALPTPCGPTLLLDAGANAECRPLHLAQFAIMGATYARRVLGVDKPRVAILANGEEETKGTELTRRAREYLRGTALNYIGYVEGRDLNAGRADVVVTDGFTGNVALKTMEGFATFAGGLLRGLFKSTWRGRAAALLLRRRLASLARAMDPAEIGGAPLLGLRGVVMVAHGASAPRAVKNALRVARDAAAADLAGRMAEAVGVLPALEPAGERRRRARRLWEELRGRFGGVRRDGREPDSLRPKPEAPGEDTHSPR